MYDFKIKIKETELDIKVIGWKHYVVYLHINKAILRKKKGKWRIWGCCGALYKAFMDNSGELWGTNTNIKRYLISLIAEDIIEKHLDYKVDTTLLGDLLIKKL